MRTLHQALLDIDLVRLRVIAHAWDIELAASRRQDVAAELAEAMPVRGAVAAAWDVLPDEQRQALETLLAAGGQMPLRVFNREWGDMRAMGPGRMEREKPWREPISPAEGLWYRGFVYRAFDHGPDGAYEIAFIPAELLAHLPIDAPSTPGIAIEPIGEPVEVRAAGDALLDDVCTLLSYLQNERLRPASDGEWPARHTDLLLRRMRDSDPERLVFQRHLVRGLAWLRVMERGHLRPDPGPVTAWLQHPTGRQRRALAEGWRSDPAWNDLFHVPTLQPEDTGAWRNDPLLAREAVLRHLATCAPGSWYRLDDFVAAIEQADPDFQRPGGDYTTWYIRDADSGEYLSGYETWDRVEGALIRYLIAGPLSWLGLVDVAAEESPSAFRLTPAGADFFGLAGAVDEPEPAPLSLHPDFTVLVSSTRRYDRFQLARVADWVSSPSWEEGNAAFVYRITPASLARARQQGIPVARVLEFLQDTSDGPVPRFARTALTRWEDRGGEARLERVVLLHLASEELMARAMASPPVRRLIRERVGAVTAVVRGSDWPRLVALLGEMGLLPDVIDLDE